MMAAVGTAPLGAELLLPFDAPRELWLAERTIGIGGSDALACLGLDPWKTRLEVYLDKLGQAPEREQTDRMRWGQIVETAILSWFVEQTDIPISRCGLLRSVERPFQLASVDALAHDGGIVEIKNTNWHRRTEWDHDQVSDSAEAQSQHYLDVTGRSHAWVVAQIGGDPPVIRRVDRDEELIGYLRTAEAQLWQAVETRTPPPLEGGKVAQRLVDRLYPHGIVGTHVDVGPDFLDLLRAYNTAHADEKAAKARKDEARADLCHRMGEATEAVHDYETVAVWPNRTRLGIDVDALRQRYPLIAVELAKPSHYRQFTPKFKEMS